MPGPLIVASDVHLNAARMLGRDLAKQTRISCAWVSVAFVEMSDAEADTLGAW